MDLPLTKYYKDILKFKYGTITNKHKRLARIAKNKNITEFKDLQQYIEEFKKYNDWTIRDIDKVHAVLTLKIYRNS